ncbi:MAG: ABC transporter substrate-binding protein [Candidatus Dormibacteria bacterium]
MTAVRRGWRGTPLRLAAACALGLAACGSPAATPGSGGSTTILVGLNVPVTADAYVSGVITRGAQLAVREQNARGVVVAGRHYQLVLRTYDDNDQPSLAAQNVQSAIGDGAAAIIEDGIGAATSAARSAAAGVPEIVITNGTSTLTDPANRPSIFRIGVTNDASATLLGTYAVQVTRHLAIIHDDTDSGRDGATQLGNALATAGGSASPVLEVPAAAAAFDSQLAEVRASGAGALAIWGGDVFTAKVVAAAWAARLNLPILTSAAGESPVVRALAGSAATEGLRFVSSRLTSEGDSTSFGKFEHRLAAAGLGPTDAGFKDNQGREVRQPNDVEVFSYDAVNLVVAALQHAGSAAPGAALLRAMDAVHVLSANGDTRGFNPMNNEAVSDDDMYVAVIHDMKFAPVRDEPLSASLPTEDQVLADFH